MQLSCKEEARCALEVWMGVVLRMSGEDDFRCAHLEGVLTWARSMLGLHATAASSLEEAEGVTSLVFRRGPRAICLSFVVTRNR